MLRQTLRPASRPREFRNSLSNASLNQGRGARVLQAKGSVGSVPGSPDLYLSVFTPSGCKMRPEGMGSRPSTQKKTALSRNHGLMFFRLQPR